MAGNIKGITIEIGGDTKGLDSALKSVTSQSVALGKDLKTVNQLLKLDPGNVELVAQKQQILAQSVQATAEKLAILRAAQEQVKQQFENGEISREQYIAFQEELVRTEQRMQSLTDEQTQMQDGFDESADSADGTADAVKDLGNEEDTAASKTDKLGDKLKNGLAAGAKAAAAALAAATAAVTATAAGIVKATGQTAEYGDNIDKMSQKLGMSAEAYQEWDFIMQHSGSDIDSMTTSMKKLSEAVVDQSDKSVKAFEKLGISMEDAAGMSQEELFSATITALQGMESGAERTALATDLLGKSAMDLAPLLNTSAEETEAMRQQVHELGGVMSDDAVKASAAYQDSLTNMKTAISGASRNITAQFMPALTGMMDGIAKIVSGDSSGIELLKSGLQQFTSQLSDLIPQLGETAAQLMPVFVGAITDSLPMLLTAAADIMTSLAGGIVDALPVLVPVAGDIILQLAQSLISMLPQIITVGIQVIAELALGIADAIPDLIPVAVDAILEIVDALIDNIDLLIDAGIKLLIAVATGLVQALPRLIEKVPVIISKLLAAIVSNLPKLLEAGVQLIGSLAGGIINAVPKIISAAGQIISSIWDTLKSLPGKALQWGKDLIGNIVQGIKDKIGAVKDAVVGVADKIKSFLHFSVPDEGPLTDFPNWMPDMMRGLATGIKKNMGVVKNAVGALAAEMVPDADMTQALSYYGQNRMPSGTPALAGAGGGQTVAGGARTFNITVNVQQMSNDYDARRAAELMAEELDRLTTDNNSMRGAWSV